MPAPVYQRDAGCAGIVGTDGKHVRLVAAKVEVAGQLVAKADVTIRPLAQVEAVDPDIAVGHDAVEVDEDTPHSISREQREMFSIPADAGGKKATCSTRRVAPVEWSFDTPVVRHVELAPRRIIKVWLFSSSLVAFEKEPIGIKGGNDAGRGGGATARREDPQKHP